MEGPEPGFVSRRAILFGPMKSHARRALRDIIQQSQDARRSSNNGETASVGSEAVIDLGAVRSSQRSGRSVAALRPRKALLIDAGISVSDAARKMAAANADAALVRTSSSSRAAVGIVTDTDVCRKVVALGRDADATAVEAVMTRNPQTVLWNATASSALCTMVDNCFRHLPVLDEAGSVAGLLDVAKCLSEALAGLHGHQLGHAVSLASLLDDPAAADGPAEEGCAMAEAGCVAPTASVQQAASVMVARRGAVLVRGEGAACAGILTPKDLLFRVIAAGLDPRDTKVGAVMTPDPHTLPVSASVLDALSQLEGSGYRNVPVVRQSGEPVGVLDILALIRGALHQMPGTGSDASETGSVINGGGRASLTNGAVSAAADEPDAVVMAPGQPRGSAEEEGPLSAETLRCELRAALAQAATAHEREARAPLRESTGCEETSAAVPLTPGLRREQVSSLADEMRLLRAQHRRTSHAVLACSVASVAITSALVFASTRPRR